MWPIYSWMRGIWRGSHTNVINQNEKDTIHYYWQVDIAYFMFNSIYLKILILYGLFLNLVIIKHEAMLSAKQYDAGDRLG